MKKIAILAVAAASLVGSSAFAQGVSFGVGPRGPGITIDDGYRRDRDFRDSRNEYRDDRRLRRDRDWDRRDRGDRVYIERE